MIQVLPASATPPESANEPGCDEGCYSRGWGNHSSCRQSTVYPLPYIHPDWPNVGPRTPQRPSWSNLQWTGRPKACFLAACWWTFIPWIFTLQTCYTQGATQYFFVYMCNRPVVQAHQGALSVIKRHNIQVCAFSLCFAPRWPTTLLVDISARCYIRKNEEVYPRSPQTMLHI